ncbi:3959_t:CDS:1, partial [Cetraspora pellucida]
IPQQLLLNKYQNELKEALKLYKFKNDNLFDIVKDYLNFNGKINTESEQIELLFKTIIYLSTKSQYTQEAYNQQKNLQESIKKLNFKYFKHTFLEEINITQEIRNDNQETRFFQISISEFILNFMYDMYFKKLIFIFSSKEPNTLILKFKGGNDTVIDNGLKTDQVILKCKEIKNNNPKINQIYYDDILNKLDNIHTYQDLFNIREKLKSDFENN